MTAKKDKFHRFMFENGSIRGGLIQLDESWKEILSKADYPESVMKQLGQAMAASVLLSSTIKFEGSLILQVRGEGALNTLVAQATHDRKIRGLAQWQEPMQAEGFRELLGKGQLVMSLVTDGKQPYQGIVTLDGDQLSDSLEQYFAQSEQLRTRLWLSADENCAAGLIIQELPAAKEQEDPEENWRRISFLAETVTGEEMRTLEAESLLHRLFHEETVLLLGGEEVRFHCNCSRERIEQTLVTLGAEDLQSLLEERGSIQVACEFCNHEYSFDSVDVAQLFAAGQLIPSGDKLH